MELPAELAPLIRSQWGLVTRAQALDAGVTDAALRWAVGRGWEIVLPSVMHVDRSPMRLSQQMLAALLYASPTGLVAGATAAWWYGLRHVPNPRVIQVDVAAPAKSRLVRWAEFRRTTVPEGRPRTAGPLRFVSPERAVVSAARQAGAHDCPALVIESVQRRLCRLERLAHENDLLGRRGSAQVGSAIREAAIGVWSVPELRLVRLVDRSPVLPPMWCNPELIDEATEQSLISPDGWFDDVGMAVMVHSRQYHDGPSFEATIESDGVLASFGVTVVGLTPRSIERDPDLVLRRVERAYLAARTRGSRPAVVARPRTAWSRPA